MVPEDGSAGQRARPPRLRVHADPASLAENAASGLLRLARRAVADRGVFDLVLAGGGTPKGLYAQLARQENDWRGWRLWFGDERCLPPRHEARNDTMVDHAWLDHVLLDPGQVHRIPAELGPNAGAAAYTERLAVVDRFDLVLLGLGEDGHTASLFPRSETGNDPESRNAPGGVANAAVLPVTGAPKPPPERVSLSAARLARTRALWFLVTGAGKRDALRRLVAGDPLIPAARIRPDCGAEQWVDRAVAEGLYPA